MLPLSRDFNLNPGDPVPSALLNALQDCIIGSKHGEWELPFHPSAFTTPTLNGATYDPAGTNWGATGGAAFKLFASLTVPVGDRITRAKLAYNRHGAGHVIVSLIEYDIATSTPTTVATFDDAVAGNVITVHQLAAINYTTLTGKAYALKFDVDAAAAAAGALVFAATAFTDKL